MGKSPLNPKNSNLNSFQVYNILEKDASKCNEIERIVFEDNDSKNGFLILPDLKWDQKTNRDLHCTALVNDRSLHSLRDLNSGHLPLLENLFHNGRKAIVKKYGFKVTFPQDLYIS